MLKPERITVVMKKSWVLLLLLFFCTTSSALASGFAVVKKWHDRKVETYRIPDLQMLNNQGQRVSLAELLDTDKPVVVNFIYATCTTICPLLSMGYVDVQRDLGKETEKILLISFTIDPEHDSPEILDGYRKRYSGKPGWTLLTGSRLDIDKVMTAFNSFFNDKMDHRPLNFIRFPDRKRWARLNGMLNGQDIYNEIKLAGYQLE
jgi:protein SCO1/2